jgi:hypothetical protein
MKYYIDVTETFIKTIAVEADSLEQAQARVEDAWHNNEFEISRMNPDYVQFPDATDVVKDCIEEGFIAEEEIETL